MKKNRVFGILLSLALMLTMMPALSQTAYAYDYAETWSKDQTVSTSREINGDVSVTNDIILRIAKGATLTVEGVIYAPGKKVTVKGPGKLVVNAPNDNNAFTGNIIVKGAVVELNGGKGRDEDFANNGGKGIYGGAIVDDGSLIVTGGDGGNGASAGSGGSGISGDLTVNGGSATVSGGDGGSGTEPGSFGKAVEGSLSDTTVTTFEESTDNDQWNTVIGTTSSKQFVRAIGPDPVSVKLDVGAGYASLFTDAVLADLVDYKDKDDEDIKIDASYATISGNVITITGIAATKLDKSMWNALDSFLVKIARDYSKKGYITVGYNTIDNYASIEALNADLIDERHDAPVSEGLTYYALWQKPYTKLEIDNGNPTCGKNGWDCKPTLPDGMILDPEYSYWIEGDEYADVLKGGNEYTYRAYIYNGRHGASDALWKYYFNEDDFTVSVKGGKNVIWTVKNYYTVEATFKATADHDWDEGKVTKEPTTTSEGEKTYTCKTVDCGATKKETIPKIKPTPTPTPTPEPTPTPKPTPSKKTAKTVVVAKAIASGKTKAKLSWNDAGADRYVIYRGICGKNMKKYKTVNGKTRKLTVSKLRSGEKYRFCVVAQKKSGKSYKTIATSGDAHMAVGNVSGSYTNVKDLKVNRKAVNLKKGRSFKIKTGLTKVRKDKRLLNSSHDKSVRFTTTDPGVAVVNSKGKITAKGKGSCRVYVQAVNGLWKTVRVTVK